MNFNQLSAAAAAAAAGNSGNLNMNSFTTAVSNILANSNIDLSQLASFTQLSQPGALSAAIQAPTSRQNLQQAHHRSANSIGALNNSHLASSMSNLQNADPSVSVAGLPASITNLTSSALADLAAGALHQPTAHQARHTTSIQSAHHRSSSSNHHSTLTAAHQSTNHHQTKALAGHQSQSNTIHHRHSLSNSSFNNSHNNSNNNNINNNNINSSNSLQIIATNNTNSIAPPNMKSSTCYRIGDCIFFETSPTMPLRIGKIDEICKDGDNIEVKLAVFFRREDIPSSLLSLADKYQYDESQEEEIKQMTEKERTLLKQRELFYSRLIETISASAIRSKCIVQLLNESESLASYLNKEDHYFYTLVYDPQQKTITADRGEIRVGQKYQAEVGPNHIYNSQPGGDPDDPRDLSELETLVYTPNHNLTDDDINKFLTITKAVGLWARALDLNTAVRWSPSIHLMASMASRDETILCAYDMLHQSGYDIGQAVFRLVPPSGPCMNISSLESFSPGESSLFQEALGKYGREMSAIRKDFLPWKSVKEIVEYYYMWKTTDRCIDQRRMKALEAENKVTVIYIQDPENEIKKSPNNVTAATGPDVNNSGKTRSLKRTQESDESSLNSTLENPNATLKRRQVTEPKLSAHVACHTTPGENLRFISTKRHKMLRRGQISRKQLRHLSRRPWERRTKLRT